MGKILGSWSSMRKCLEQEMLAESLKGRVRYGCTTYPGMEDDKIFEICVDGKQVKRFSFETVNTYFIKNRYKKDSEPFGKSQYWAEFWEIMRKTPPEVRTEYTDREFCDALREYRNQDIMISICSGNPLVRLFAILDRRIGKRTLLNSVKNIENQPEWLRQFYRLRMDAKHV